MIKLRGLILTGFLSAIALITAYLMPQFSSFGQTNPAGATVVSHYTLNPVQLKASLERVWPGLVSDDRGINLGGLFSGLDRVRTDPDTIFYATGDRGPNGQVKIGKERRRTFPVPEYSPSLYKLSLSGDRIEIVQIIPIRTRSGKPVTGLSNTPNDEPPYTYDGKTLLSLNPNGLDIEGVARAPDGTFWVCDEYSPSVVHIAADGTVLHRLIPEGMTLNAETDVRSTLPTLYAKRRLNRGFEGLALTQDGSQLLVALQSPLDFPTKEIGRASRTIRFLVIDPQKLGPIAEYVYVAEPSSTFREQDQGEVKIGDVAFVNPQTVLVVERTDKVARIYQVSLNQATNILGSRWSQSQITGTALEALAPEQLTTNGITPVAKRLLVDLSQIPQIPNKIEGLTIVNPTTLAIGNDNDFGFDKFDARGRAIPNSIANSLFILRLPQALPLSP